jgi:glycosyltransferase involved in cell wall biosynthesis/tetratricopeptide (TPR) repeat protein
LPQVWIHAMNLAQLREQLSPLEQRCASAELLARAQCLMPLVAAGSAEEAYVNYAMGKAWVGLAHYGAAVHPLHRCLQIQPGHSHAHYLLGYCLAQQCQWSAALAAQQRSCGLNPQLADAWYEQGRAALELGQEALAAAALEQAVARRPHWEAAAGLWHAARVRLALAHGAQAGAEPAAALIRQLLSQALPPQWLLLQWLELAGTLLLAGELEQARVLLEALATPSPSPAACGLPLPRRVALLLRVLIGLLVPGAAEAAQPWASALREALWLPPSTAEHGLWQPLIEPALWLLLARSGTRLEPAPLGHLLLDSLPAVEPAGLNTRELYATIAERLPHREQHGFLHVARRLNQAHSDLGSLAWLPEALAAGRERLQRQPADGQVRRLLHQHLLALSQQMLELPNRLVSLPGHTGTALALRNQAVAAIVQANAALAELDQQPPAPARPGARRRWLLLASRDLPQCVLYRVEQKRQQLERLGCQVRLLWREQLDSWAFTPHLLWAEAVVVCRLAATHAVLRAMAAARRFGLPVYYDIDDLLFDPEHCPPPLASYGGTLSPAQHRRFGLDVPLVAAAMRQADGLIFSTPTLARRWRELHPHWDRPVWVLPNLAPPELWLQLTPPRLPGAGPLRLVVASGTTAHKQAWQEELAPALALLLDRNPQLRLDLLGHLQVPEPLLAWAERIRCRPFTAYGRYLQQLAQADIGLVVLEPGTFTDAKSAIRWMEFSLLGLASVLSPTATYTEQLEHGREALFARGVEAWVQAVQQLIDDPARRLALAQQAQARARDLCAPACADAFWQPLIEPQPEPEPAPEPAPRRRRLLVINVFFAPQAIGGATRVAQDQVRQLLERAGDRYAVTVLCADHGPWQLEPAAEDDPEQGGDDSAHQPLAVDCHSWHGARVVRLALPPRPWRQHHDPQVAAFCRQWFADEGFDLIHAHCLQLLTAAPLVAAAELGIPYLVTLHDGWWLSPRLFLTTVSGRLIDPADPLGHYDDPAAQDPELLAADRQRRQQLEQVLARADARLAVSEAFAEVYRSGGVRAVAVLENDWQPMASRRSRPRSVRPADQPLRLCYVGGLALHKGYAVLQAALLRHRLAEAGAGAQLTVIDSTLQPGEGYSLHWNGTGVEFRPAVPMAEMAAFYAEQDVLVAPSIWQESYGLVTREALSAGLWVVASAVGALADPIRPGVNGHTVPPGDADALGRVLLQLCDAHPSPQPLVQFHAGRQAIEQLLPLYDRLSS